MNLRIMARIANQRITVSMSPARGERRPKKAADQRILRMSWIAKTKRAVFTLGSWKPLFHTRNNEIPIIMTRVVQTGKNTQFGGAMNGFIYLAYQVEIAGAVKKEPKAPAVRQITILVINRRLSNVFIGIIN